MEIIKRKSGGLVELEIKGRLDGYWADHLAKALDDEIRQGSFRLSRGRVLTTSHAGTTLVMGICAGSAPRRIRAANSPVCLPIW